MKHWAVLVLAMAVAAGCASEPPLPLARGTQVTGDALAKLFTGATIYGRWYRTNNRYIERYHSDGRYNLVSTKTPSAEDYAHEETGTWRIERDTVCYAVAAENSSGCALVYEADGQVEFVNPETGRAWSVTHKIEYEQNEPPTTAETSPPVGAAVPAPANPDRKLQPVGSGSGFIVSNDTYVLTNAHVVKGCRAVTVMFDGQDVPATVKARDRQNDLALLQLPAGKHPVAVFQAGNGLYPGDSVVAIGYPLSEILASEGTVSVGIVNALAGLGNNASLLQISNPIQPGNSGGPLFDMSGHVVGVIVAKLDFAFALETYGTLPQNVNFAIKSSVATAFLQASGVEYRMEKSSKELRPSDVARKGRPVTVPVWCWE